MARTSIDTMAINPARRTFLKAGLLGGLALAAAGGLYRARNPGGPPLRFRLEGEAQAALGAISAAILRDALLPPGAAMPASPATQAAMERIKVSIAGLPLSTQKEIQDLFGLLTFGPTRRFLAKVPDRWQDAKGEDVSAFLQHWRTHRIAMFQSAYHALHDIVLGSWYADASTWAAIGYPGPMKGLA
jgi:hypothetical protein